MDQIADRTDGVPLFVEELTKSVLESGVTPLGSIVERKLRRRQLTEDGNVEISGRVRSRELRYSLANFGGLVLGSSDA